MPFWSYGAFVIPFGDDEMIEGKWISLDHQKAKKEHIAAFDSIHKAAQGVYEHEQHLGAILRLIAADDMQG